jgi:hypothetical protein
LIGALVADGETRTAPLGSSLALAEAGGAILSAALFAAVLGPRPDVMAALATPRFLLKFAECAALAAATGLLAVAMLRPAADRRTGRVALVAVGLLVLLGVVVEAALVPRGEWGVRLVGSNWFHCLTLIPLLAAPAFVVLTAAARRGAPTEPAWTGAVVGALSGAIGAFFYAANCTDDSPFFVVTWYTLAIAAMAVVGGVTGRRFLSW